MTCHDTKDNAGLIDCIPVSKTNNKNVFSVAQGQMLVASGDQAPLEHSLETIFKLFKILYKLYLKIIFPGRGRYHMLIKVNIF